MSQTYRNNLFLPNEALVMSLTPGFRTVSIFSFVFLHLNAVYFFNKEKTMSNISKLK